MTAAAPESAGVSLPQGRDPEILLRGLTQALGAAEARALRVPAHPWDEAALGLDRAARRDVQRLLAAAGYAPGPLDGIFGPRTRGALRAWQLIREWPATGYLNDQQHAQLISDIGPAGHCAVAGGRIRPDQSLRCDLMALLDTN